MTARVDLQSNVTVSSEPGLSYFSQYPAIISRSIWDPLAPGVLGGAKDLAGRAVIIMTVLLGCCLIIALFAKYFGRKHPPPPKGTPKIDRTISDEQRKENLRRLSQAQSVSQQSLEHPYGQKNSSDICAVLHTHHKSIDTTFSFTKEEILDLCENLEEKECIYTGDLEVEKKQIELLRQDAQQLVNYITIAQRRHEEIKSKIALGAPISDFASEINSFTYASGALFVFLGIKPALAMEKKPDEALSLILTELAQKHRNLRLSAPNGFSAVYFVNEKPFSSFDPREFLNLSSEFTLMEAVATCFPVQRQRDADQFLSYLLGFGPSWENYATGTRYLYQEKDSVSCMFSNKHYYEIGNVLNQALCNKGEKSESEKLGLIFHSQFASLIEQCHWTRKFSITKDGALEKRLHMTGTGQAFDGLTARTDYFKKSYTLKKWVMETYFPQLL